ncbi:MAG TPA: HAD family acid phosphatase [Candidatus Obscuribacterales bacterium]
MRTKTCQGWIAQAITVSLCLCPPCFAFPAKDAQSPTQPPFPVGNKVGLEFSKTAEYRKEFDAAINGAYEAIEDFLSRKKKGEQLGRPAVISDLDETLLDNREHFEKEPHFSWPAFEAWIKEARAPVLKKTARMLSWARKKGVAIFFVTGRHEGLRADTIANLIHEQVAYDGLLMRSAHDERSASQVKTPLREEVEKMGFVIVVNIGDQFSDLAGGHAIDCEKLPNRIYFVE